VVGDRDAVGDAGRWAFVPVKCRDIGPWRVARAWVRRPPAKIMQYLEIRPFSDRATRAASAASGRLLELVAVVLSPWSRARRV